MILQKTQVKPHWQGHRRHSCFSCLSFFSPFFPRHSSLAHLQESHCSHRHHSSQTVSEAEHLLPWWLSITKHTLGGAGTIHILLTLQFALTVCGECLQKTPGGHRKSWIQKRAAVTGKQQAEEKIAISLAWCTVLESWSLMERKLGHLG